MKTKQILCKAIIIIVLFYPQFLYLSYIQFNVSTLIYTNPDMITQRAK